MEPFVENLIVDAAGFIKLVKLEQIGKKIFTIREVVDEIRDAATRQRLQVLPYELHYLNPTPEALKIVTEFSKKTGDYASLSATDLRLIAAVFQLESELNGVEHLSKNPQIAKTVNPPTGDKSTPKLPGFHLSDAKHSLEKSLNELNVEDEIENEVSSSSDEGDGDWITPENIGHIVSDPLVDRKPCSVACITADFAVQNVLLHFGLHVVSADGVLIKRLRTYILRCYACLKTTSIMSKKFCPECGNATLKRVSVTVNEDGSVEYYINFRRPINTKGTNKSIPMPKGGKHANNPILCEDQPVAENRLSKKALQKLNVLDDDYLSRDSPFLTKDVYSRSAMLGVRRLNVNKRSSKKK